jgi:hypothetical protein
MLTYLKRLGGVALLSAAVLLVAVPESKAQNPFFQVAPGLTLQQYATNVATIGRAFQQVPPYALGFNPYSRIGGGMGYGGGAGGGVNPYANPYLAANPYAAADLGASMYGYGGYPYDPTYGYLKGGADVINAQGKLMTNQQQAFLMKEQVRSERLKNRRALFDEYLYERDKMPTAEDDRQRYIMRQLDRSRNNPPVTEIVSGKALNDLLSALSKQAGTNKDAAPVLRTFQAPDEDLLQRVNVVPTKSVGNVGVLRNHGRLTWPVALSGPQFREEREQVNTLAQDAVNQAEFNNQVDAGTLRDLMTHISNLQQQLRANGGDLPPNLYIESRTFLNNLDSAATALQQKDAGRLFKYNLQAKSLPDLVRYMSSHGLEFGPATPGDEAAYMALYRSLASYDNAVRPETSKR